MTLSSSQRLLSALTLLTVALFAAGCETTAPTTKSAGVTAAPVPTFPREAMKRLRVGMVKADVISLVGEPTEKKSRDKEQSSGEIWTYVNWLEPLYRPVAVEMDETSYTDPITGIERKILDPRQQMERIVRQEFFELTFDDQGNLVNLGYDVVQNREI